MIVKFINESDSPSSVDVIRELPYALIKLIGENNITPDRIHMDSLEDANLSWGIGTAFLKKLAADYGFAKTGYGLKLSTDNEFTYKFVFTYGGTPFMFVDSYKVQTSKRTFHHRLYVTDDFVRTTDIRKHIDFGLSKCSNGSYTNVYQEYDFGISVVKYILNQIGRVENVDLDFYVITVPTDEIPIYPDERSVIAGKEPKLTPKGERMSIEGQFSPVLTSLREDGMDEGSIKMVDDIISSCERPLVLGKYIDLCFRRNELKDIVDEDALDALGDLISSCKRPWVLRKYFDLCFKKRELENA